MIMMIGFCRISHKLWLFFHFFETEMIIYFILSYSLKLLSFLFVFKLNSDYLYTKMLQSCLGLLMK